MKKHFRYLKMSYSGGKKNPDLQIKTTENVHMTRRHCKFLIKTATDAVLIQSMIRNRITDIIY